MGHDFFESRHRHRDGRVIDVEVSAHYLAEQKVFVGLFCDITERKLLQQKLESSLEFSNRLIAGMHDGVVVLDKNGCIQDVNISACKMYGFTRDELVGATAPFPYWPPEEQENMLAIFNHARVVDSREVEVTHMRKNGERFPVVISPALIRNESGEVVSVISTIKEISAAKAEEAVLLNARKAVNREVLVREVHHRIKNNLQGITGILRLKANKSPELSESIQQAISQIQSVAFIHGLQGYTGKSQVRLFELTVAIAN